MQKRFPNYPALLLETPRHYLLAQAQKLLPSVHPVVDVAGKRA
jgi:hypothetical protein